MEVAIFDSLATVDNGAYGVAAGGIVALMTVAISLGTHHQVPVGNKLFAIVVVALIAVGCVADGLVLSRGHATRVENTLIIIWLATPGYWIVQNLVGRNVFGP